MVEREFNAHEMESGYATTVTPSVVQNLMETKTNCSHFIQKLEVVKFRSCKLIAK